MYKVNIVQSVGVGVGGFDQLGALDKTVPSGHQYIADLAVIFIG